ncbi:MAG: exodeoxyribonuclease VII large subunit [Collinsella sp.]|nr:exodeoxyribonuclease VII large subunit [Collinsella sp.]
MSGWSLTGGSTGVETGTGGDALSVSQAVDMAAGAIDAIPQITVLGEVTGFREPNARSGHCYFQIKDESSAMDCVVWRGVYAKRTFDLRDGMQVQFTGSFNLYKPTGKMSFVVRSLRLAGEGLLRQQVAALAESLRREGLMDASRRRRIPVFCSRVAVVTSLSGAVIDDVKRTLRRRNPLVELVCVGSKVQGEGAPAELVAALARAASMEPAPDCILLVRGGGSFEDLMTFNDEALARAVAACPVPVVTGIGHEPDTTICDMVSDRRCSTPTAAAESVAPSISELVEVLGSREHRLLKSFDALVDGLGSDMDSLGERMDRAVSAAIQSERRALEAFASRPCLSRPGAVIERRAAELAMTEDRLGSARDRALGGFSTALERAALRLAAAKAPLSTSRHVLELQESRLTHAAGSITAPRSAALASAAGKLDALSPLKVLARGYSIAFKTDGSVARAASVSVGEEISIRMSDGEVSASVLSVSAR